MAFFLYLVQAGLYGILLWAVYCCVWRGSGAHRSGRVVLLLSAIVPLLLPLIRIHVDAVSQIGLYHITLPEVVTSAASRASADASSGSLTCVNMLLWCYIAIAASIAMMHGLVLAKLLAVLRKSRMQQHARFRIITRTGAGPGTLWRWIFFPGNEVDDTVLRHELAHISAGHRWDALLMLALRIPFWALPHLWLIMRELRMVHEFEADAAALDGGDAEQYATLLLSQTFGTGRFSIGQSFFHHPLKRRIMMLQKNGRGERVIRRTLLAATLCLIVCGAAVFVQCRQKKQEEESVPHGWPKSPPGAYYVQSFDLVYRMVDTMPHFKGDLNEYLNKHLHYPESARKLRHEGRIAMRFYVDRKGRVVMPLPIRESNDTALNHEAFRVIEEMPDWEPGILHGQPVAVEFLLPITFKLDK